MTEKTPCKYKMSFILHLFLLFLFIQNLNMMDSYICAAPNVQAIYTTLTFSIGKKHTFCIYDINMDRGQKSCP